MSVIDKFMSLMMEREEDMNSSPIIQHGNTTFIFIKYNSLYLVATSKKNANVTLVFSFLHKLVQVSLTSIIDCFKVIKWKPKPIWCKTLLTCTFTHWIIEKERHQICYNNATYLQLQSVKHFLIFLSIPDFSWFVAIPDIFLNFMWKLLITPDFQLFTLKKIMLK